MDEEILLIRRDGADARIFDLVGDVEVADQLVALRSRAGETAPRPLERHGRLRDRERVLTEPGHEVGEAVPESPAALAPGLEVPLDRPFRRRHSPPSRRARRPPPS